MTEHSEYCSKLIYPLRFGALPRLTGRLRSLRHRGGRERLLDDPEHGRALTLDYRHEPAELEPDELDPAFRADGMEAEVGEEVAREDGLVHDEALVGRLALRVPVGERLERLRALVPRLADRREEERLLDPRRRARDDVDNGQAPEENDLRMDWDFDGIELDEEEKLREETRKILELPVLPVSATCVRVPVLVGHAEAIWVETQEPLSAEQASSILGAAPGIRLEQFPTPGGAAGGNDVLVGRIRKDSTTENGLVLFVVGDNLRKGAALNAIQIAELLLAQQRVAA